jgi:chromate transporter
LNLDRLQPASAPPGTAGELTRLFLRLGFTAFGGPAALIAMLKDEVVHRKHWLTEAEFLDLLGATNLIPGPNSTEMAIHIGYRRLGWRGLLIGGLCFLLPAALMVCGFAWAYAKYGSLPAVSGLLYGVKPVIIAVVAHAIWGLLKPAIKTPFLAFLGFGMLILAVLRVDTLLILFGAGALTSLVRWAAAPEPGRPRPSISSLLWMFLIAGTIVALPMVMASLPEGSAQLHAESHGAPFSLPRLFLFFLKIGSVLYGGGYVLLAFLRDGLVTRWHWLTSAQLLDATAVGQVTPGPLFTTATFVGYLLGGPLGAAVATIGIFLPSFVFVALSGPLVPRLRKSPLMGAFLDGVNVAALALMAAVTWELGGAALIDWTTVVLALVSAAFLFRYRVNPAWLILGAAAFGVLQATFRP